MKLMNQMKMAFLIAIMLANLGCNSDSFLETTEVKSADTKTNLVNFGKISEKTFYVDSLSDWHFVFPQTLTLNGHKTILSIDIVSNGLLAYDYESGVLIEKIDLPKAGPESTKGKVIGFQALSRDSLFVVDAALNVSLFDFDGKLKSQMSVLSTPTDQPQFRHNAIPAIYRDGELIIENYPIINPQRNMKIILDIKDSSVRQTTPIPNEFLDGFYGLGDFGYYSFIVNEDSERLVYNFPNLDSLYSWTYDMQSLEKIYAGSKLFNHPIKPIADISKAVPNAEELSRRPFRRPIYSMLFYDKNEKMYYRLVGKPIPESVLDLKDPIKSQTRKYSVLVLDSDFKWLGEFNLPDYEYIINTEMTFFNDQGIHFQKESIDEDIALFDVYKVMSR
ncbi:DUF4221 family protein [Roseivirga echinicomitans]